MATIYLLSNYFFQNLQLPDYQQNVEQNRLKRPFTAIIYRLLRAILRKNIEIKQIL